MKLDQEKKVLLMKIVAGFMLLLIGTMATSFFMNSEKKAPPTALLDEKIAEPPKMDRVSLPTLEDLNSLPEVDNSKADEYWLSKRKGDRIGNEYVPSQSEIDTAKKKGVIEDEEMKKQVQYFREIYEDEELGMVIIQNSGNNRNMLIRLSDAKTGELVAQIHCPQFDMAKAMLPIGAYAVEIEQGIRWYGEKYGFAKRSVVESLDVVVSVRPTSEGREAYLEFNSDTPNAQNPNAGDPFAAMYGNYSGLNK